MDESFDKPLHEQLGEFPCAFNLIGAEKVKLNRIKVENMRHNIDSELAVGGDSQHELIRKKNLLTWVLFCLDKVDEAVELSNEINELTKWRNISSLGNRAYVTKAGGDVREAKRCIGILEAIKLEDDFQPLLTEAKSEQAYYYSRIGGPQNLSRAISLFSEAVAQFPENYLWKFGLGLCYRRSLNSNMYCSSPEPMDVEKNREEAIKLLLDIADHADANLQAMAYAELVQVRKYLPRNYPHFNLFRRLSVSSLCKKALKGGENLPLVLASCGKALRSSDVNESIRLLEKSAAIKETSATLHHLGKSYVRKAEKMASIFYIPPRPRFNYPSQSCKSHATPFIREMLHTEGNKTSFSSAGRRESELSHSTESKSDRRNLNVGALSLPQYTCPRDDDSQLGAIGVIRQHNKSSLFHEKEPRPLFGRAKEPPSKFYTYRYHVGTSRWDQNRETFSGRSCGFSQRENLNRSVSYADTNKKNEAPTQIEQTRHLNRRRHENSGEQKGGHRGDYIRSRLVGYIPSKKEVNNQLKYAGKDFDVQLIRNDECVQKAINSFQQAIRISRENLPAIFDLGMLLKRTEQTEEALKQFNEVVMSGSSNTGNILTVISAHEQAGLCYLQLGKEEEGREMLFKAVSMEASLTATMPELKKSCNDIWTTFITLINDADQTPPSLDEEKRKIGLLKMVHGNKELAKGIRDLLKDYKPNELKNQEIVMATLETFLSLGQPEDALTFKTLVGIGQAGDSNSWWNNDAFTALKAKVMLQASYRRLKENKGNPIFLFQQLFELSYGACVGMRINEEEETATNEAMVGDVLVVFDKDQASSEGPSETMRVASCFKEVAARLFGLEAHENLKVTEKYEVACELLLNQMWMYHTVVVVVGDEPRKGMFKNILEQIPVNNHGTIAPRSKIRILDAGRGEDQLPQCWRFHECLRLDEIGGLGYINQEGRGEDGAVPYTEIVERVFRGNVDAILKLFCFLTGGSWPLP